MTLRDKAQAATRKTTFDCQECGMLIEGPMFHPYWHCVLFKGGVDPRKPLDPPDPHIEALADALRALVDWSYDPEGGTTKELVPVIEQARAALAALDGAP